MSFIASVSRPSQQQQQQHGFHDPDSTASIDGQLHFAAPTSTMADPSTHAFYNPNMQSQMSCDIKPRLTKEQHDILEAHFLKQNKPNTQTKKSFADSLNVSLDKVNNWFQNRRAKSKQDAKKQAGSLGLLGQSQDSPNNQVTKASPTTATTTTSTTTTQASESGNSSDPSDTSSAFSPSDYFTMVQSCTSADDSSLSIGHDSHSSSTAEQCWSIHESSGQSLDHLTVPNGYGGQDVFDGTQDINRRTLTQEQFDAFAQHAGMMQAGAESFFDPGNEDNLQQLFPGFEYKQSTDISYLGEAPLSSHDSSLPSSISDLSTFPSTTSIRDMGSGSSTSDWTDSRSSSISTSGNDMGYPQMPPVTQQPISSTAQWQPGQSVPVDPTAQYQQFREAAQARRQSEQSLVWPADEFPRRESQSSALLTQQLSNFGLQTPAPTQDGAFKAPPPPASIAARRQKPRPAALGLASLRSQSYSGAAQPNSPGQGQSQGQSLAGMASNQPQLRRIRSSNIVNAAAPGRVMKSTPGSAQRSPLNWTFAEAMTSPKALRHTSSASLNGAFAPPTPLSPRDSTGVSEQRPNFPSWQSANFSRQASISETDAEHSVPIPLGSSHTNFSSPPHTPMFHSQTQQPLQFVTTQVTNGVVTENTPPQSAPAMQQTFPTTAFMTPQGQASQQPTQFLPPPMYMNAINPEQPYQLGPGPIVSQSPFVIQGHSVPVQFAHGVPILDSQGPATMAFHPSMQFIPNSSTSMQHMHASAPAQYSFVTSGAVNGMSVLPQPPKSQPQAPAELFVHEYSPPSDLKRTAIPRKSTLADAGPKNYTFANQGPEHFEKEKSKKAGSDTKSVGSPSSATSSS